MNPIFALIFPLGDNTPGLTPGLPLPTPPVYPGQGLPMPPAHPSHPIIIPPGAIGPGAPSHPIVLPDPPGVDNTLPGGPPVYPGQGLPIPPARPVHPIVYPPGYPDQGLPPTPGLPPLVPTNPIAGPPVPGQLPIMPPVHPWLPGHGPGANLSLPEGSVLLIPVPSDTPLPVPTGVVAGSAPYIAWAGRGTAPVLVWVPPKATTTY